MSSPTSRTLQLLKQHGFHAGVVERWIPQARKRIDLFGCIDMIALVNGRTVGIQATSGSNVAARITKAKAEPRLLDWLAANNRFWVVGWSKKGKAGSRKLWRFRVEELTYHGGNWFVNPGFYFGEGQEQPHVVAASPPARGGRSGNG